MLPITEMMDKDNLYRLKRNFGEVGASREMLRRCLNGQYRPLMRTPLSINKFMEEISAIFLAEFDAEMRFRARAAKGATKEGIKLLNRLDKYFHDKK